MFQRACRALEYLKSRPEWDGRILIVSGGSQGGAQALAAAGLDPQVTCCVALVPALCDHHGLLAGRQPSWPYLNGGGTAFRSIRRWWRAPDISIAPTSRRG